MRLCVSVCFLIFLFGVTAVAADPWTDDEIRLLSYNIYHGGQDFGQVSGRQHEWLEVIRSRNPDIILFQEAKYWLPSDSNYVAAYTESLNVSFPDETPYESHVGDGNSIFDLALFTRLPLVSVEMVTSAWLDGSWFYPSKGFLHAVVMDSAGPQHLINAHFKHGGDYRAFREQEARVLLQILDGIPSNEPVWIGGDFNSYSPVDVEPGSPTPPAYDLGAAPAEEIGWEPVGYLLERGYQDAFRVMNPLDLGYTKHTREFYGYTIEPTMRVDFLLRSSHVGWTLDTAEVVVDGLADVASDHYPVFAVYSRWTGTTDVAQGNSGSSTFSLRCRPNPFSTDTSIEFSGLEGGVVQVWVFSVTGRRVKSLVCPPGAREVVWDGRDDRGLDLPAGWYYVRLVSQGDSETTRVLLLR